MKRLARRTTLAAAATALALVGGVAAEATAARQAARSVAGRPQSPVVIRNGAFRVTGPAGSIAHVRLANPLRVPAKENPRLRISATGEWAAVVLHRESALSGAAAMTIGMMDSGLVCASCPGERLVDSTPADATLPPGRYILGLAGEPGTMVTFSLAEEAVDGAAGRTPPLLRGLYRLPGAGYESREIPEARPPSDAVYRAGHGQLAIPTLGRRMLAGVLLGADLPGGGGYSFAICPGAYGLSRQDELASIARPTCSGYLTSTGGLTPQPALPGGERYRNLSVTAAGGTYEGVTGGSFAISCGTASCDYAAHAFVFALDS